MRLSSKISSSGNGHEFWRSGPHDMNRRGRLTRFRTFAQQAIEASFASLVIQALGVAVSLIWLRILPIAENAAFALCVTTIGFVAVASDLGLTASISFFWRESVRGGATFSSRFAAILKLRWLLFVIAGLCGACALFYLLGRYGLSPLKRLMLIAATLAACWFQINSTMRLLILRLGFQLRQAYLADFAGSLVRACFAAIAALLVFGKAIFAVSSLAAGSLLTLSLTNSSKTVLLDSAKPGEKPNAGPVWRFILPTMPATAIFALQDPFIYWMATVQGGSHVVAQTFAIGRVAAIFLIINNVMSNVIMPRVVNATHNRSAHALGLVSIGLAAIFCIALIAIFMLLPRLGTIAMGPRYMGLEVEMLIAIACAGFHSLAQAMGQLNRAMGWVKLEPMMIGIHVILVIALALYHDFSTTFGVVSFSLILAAMGFLEMTIISALNWFGHPPDNELQQGKE